MNDIQPQGHPQGDGGHEDTDIGLRGIVRFAIALVAVTILLQVALGMWMGTLAREERRQLAERPARLLDETGQFPAPQLQGNPGTDMARFRREEQARLEAYGWVDRRNGIARIPIERAMDIIAERGLPTREPAPSSAKEAP